MATQPISRSVIGVCVGIDRPQLLHDLNAAGDGAKRFHKWLLGQKKYGVEVSSTLLTDAKGTSVTRSSILRAVKDAIDRSCDVLFIYLAGHGVAHSAYEEKLLLSGVKDDDSEAVNLAIVKQRAKFCGIPHVVVIYDACRSFAVTEKLRQISAGPIFPPTTNSKTGGHVDIFYACAPDGSSYEVADNSGAHPKNYKAFFTELLIDSILTAPADLIEIAQLGQAAIPVISCAKLELLLEHDVPKKAAAASPPFEQLPDIDVLSHMPAEFFCVSKKKVNYIDSTEEALAAQRRNNGLSQTDNTLNGQSLKKALNTGSRRFRANAHRSLTPPRKLDRAELVRARAAEVFAGAVPTVDSKRTTAMLQSVSQQSGFDRIVADVVRTKGRPKFETFCGFTVLGQRPRYIELSNNPPAEFVQSDSTPREHHYRVGNQQNPARGGTALIEFESGDGVALAILPGYIGTVLIEENQIRAITYSLSANTNEAAFYQSKTVEIDRRRAVAFAAASIGQLKQLVDWFGSSLPNYIRVDKAADPCLGLLAAHAYHLAGNQQQVESIWEWMTRTTLGSRVGHSRIAVPVPFDVAMLAGKLDRERVAAAPGIAPFCPWLSLGWTLLEMFELELHPAIVEAGRHRLPGTWTSFSKRGLAVLREAFAAKEIR
jgi:Caspase domain